MTELDACIYEALVRTAARIAEINHLSCQVQSTEFDAVEVRYARPGRSIGHELPNITLAQVEHRPLLASSIRQALERLANNVLRQ